MLQINSCPRGVAVSSISSSFLFPFVRFVPFVVDISLPFSVKFRAFPWSKNLHPLLPVL